MIDTDTRQLRRSAAGVYTGGAGKIPCDHCGNQVCGLAPATACSVFLPALPFRDRTGLDHVANTVRIGKAWTTRLVMNQLVALYDASKKEIFGHSRVIAMDVGPIRPMLERHAHANHLLLGTDRAAAPETLYQWQIRNYGPRIVNEDTTITAIYLLREPDREE